MAQRWLALTILTTARISLGFQFQSVASVAALLIPDLGLSFADVGFLLGLYMLPGIVLAMPGGMLGQRFGDKRMVCIGLALMAAGGVMTGLADGYPALIAGRLVSGTGGVLLNVLMSKMVTDWFVGREIVLAMAIFINGFPIGVGLGLLALGRLAELYGWGVALNTTTGCALAALLLVALAYRRHANDRKPTIVAPAGGRISLREVLLVSLAGAIWSAFNGAHSIFVGFTPLFLVGAGLTVSRAGFLVGLAAWLLVLSIQAGGLIGQRWKRSGALMAVSVVLTSIGFVSLPSTEPTPALVMIGLAMGLPVGTIMALPATVLRPQTRATGIGLFYSWLYVGYAGLPPIAGWLQDLSGNPATALYCAGGLMLIILPLYGGFRLSRPALARAAG